jgi:hypothetical protein
MVSEGRAMIIAAGTTAALLWVMPNVPWLQEILGTKTTIEITNETYAEELKNLTDACNLELSQYIQICENLARYLGLKCRDLLIW